MTLWFVCTGAVNRSPAAVVIWNSFGLPLKARAGAASRHGAGRPIAPRMRTALGANGFEVPAHYRSRPLDLCDVREGDPVWCMQPSHLVRVKELFPYAEPRLLGGLVGLKKIPDPHFSKPPRPAEGVIPCDCKPILGVHGQVVDLLVKALTKLREEMYGRHE